MNKKKYRMELVCYIFRDTASENVEVLTFTKERLEMMRRYLGKELFEEMYEPVGVGGDV